MTGSLISSPAPTSPVQPPALRRGTLARLAVVVVLAVAGCAATPASGADVQVVPLDGSLHHAHGIVVTDGGELLVGTHRGVVSLSEDGTLAPVGTSQDDYMGLSGVPGTDRLVASGHPGPGSDFPEPVGLIASDDGGRTWAAVSLTGEVDFHALATDGSLVVGYDGRAGLLISEDAGTTFTPGAAVAAAALAVREGEVYATTSDGLQRSTDGGRTFSVVPDTPLLVLLAAGRDGSLWGVDTQGRAWRSPDGESWEKRGQPGRVEALGVADHGRAYAIRSGELSILS